MLINFFMVACGATLGVLARVLTTKWVIKKWDDLFPAATFLINVLGSLLLGFITALHFGGNVSLLLGTGFMGSFTTFSTFNMENMELLRQKKYKIFIGYLGGTYILGIAAVFAGIAMGRMF